MAAVQARGALVLREHLQLHRLQARLAAAIHEVLQQLHRRAAAARLRHRAHGPQPPPPQCRPWRHQREGEHVAAFGVDRRTPQAQVHALAQHKARPLVQGQVEGADQVVGKGPHEGRVQGSGGELVGGDEGEGSHA